MNLIGSKIVGLTKTLESQDLLILENAEKSLKDRRLFVFQVCNSIGELIDSACNSGFIQLFRQKISELN